MNHWLVFYWRMASCVIFEFKYWDWSLEGRQNILFCHIYRNVDKPFTSGSFSDLSGIRMDTMVFPSFFPLESVDLSRKSETIERKIKSALIFVSRKFPKNTWIWESSTEVGMDPQFFGPFSVWVQENFLDSCWQFFLQVEFNCFKSQRSMLSCQYYLRVTHIPPVEV